MIGLLLAAQLAVMAHAPDTASMCAPIDVTVAARAPGTVPPHIAAGALPASLQLLRNTVITRIERDGAGRATAMSEATFTYAADQASRVSLPVFNAYVGSVHATASAEPVNVHPASSLPPTVIVRAWLDRGGGKGIADSLYVGQQMDYVVDVHLNEAARQRLRRNPTFFPPEMPGVLAYDLAAPSAVTRTGHRCFETLSYRRALFPLFAGRSVIAPAALTYSLPLSTSFFSREETFELRTDSVRFTALDVPTEHRPAAFGGAVGALTVSSRLTPSQVRMGDPVVLTLHVEGTGNVKLWPRPALAVSWGTLAAGAERVTVDTSGTAVKGSKEFDWLLTPRTAGSQQVPGITYQYFDAEQQRYGSATAAPLTLDVAAATLASADSTPVPRLSIRRTVRAETSAPISTRSLFWVLLAVAPVPAAFRRSRVRRHARRDTRSHASRLRAVATRKDVASPRAVRKLFLSAVRERVPTAISATRSAEFARALRRNGVSPDVADDAAHLFDQLDEAAFSSAGTMPAGVLDHAVQVVDAIEAEAVKTMSPAGQAAVALMIVAALALTANALPDGVSATFGAGVQAYDNASFATAERLFARAAAVAPGAVDAWANLGAAEWARGDSAAAVRSWQRALRLDPLDTDTRDRLERVDPPLLRTPGYVPPIPPDALAFAALVLWYLAWTLLALSPRWRPTRSRAMAGATMTVAVVLLLAELELRDRLDVRGLAVLRDTRMLLEAPSAAKAAASGVVGETGSIGPREGAWVRISLDNARAGWVPVASVLFLDASPTDN